MKLPAPDAERAMYVPHPFTDYCPSPMPDGSMLWHAVTGDGADADLRAARWNLIWLSSPALEHALTLPRAGGPHWKAVVPNLHLSVLAPIRPELRHAVLCEPSVFRAWLARQRGDCMLNANDAVMPMVLARLDETIARLATRRMPEPSANNRCNVTFVDFRAAR
ncbi:hypothetical protein [Methyloversatilis thermotolerans]|uniref:hypothetical protein n=1 Tax=Methyloversatilis thermotolerans TaxID=1346290 RepID=UPI001E54BD42|nr:hypothetical protein [Methyloversatilis thermotolerans]